MKKLAILLTLLLTLSLMTGLVSSAALAVETYDLVKSTPTIDGTIADGEYGVSFTMDKDHNSCWYGEFTGDVTYYLTWDETGLYYAAKVTDDSVYLCDPAVSNDPPAHDCLQISLNPNGLIKSKAEGLFISIAPGVDGTVYVKRHNYGLDEEGNAVIVTKDIEGKSVLADGGYVLEVKIGWSFVTDCAEFADFEPTKASTAAQVTYMDYDASGDSWPLIAAYRYGAGLMGKYKSDFTVGNFALVLNMVETATEPEPVVDDPVEPAESDAEEPVKSDAEESTKSDAADDKTDTKEPATDNTLTYVIIGVVVVAAVVVVILLATKKKK